jgi:hypothetical protein
VTNKKSDINHSVSIKVGNISSANGEVNIAGGNIEINKFTGDLNALEINQLFDKIIKTIDRRKNTSSADKTDLKSEVMIIQNKIAEAVETKKKMDEGSLTRPFRNIARMAPDILDVIVATLGSPLAGMGEIIKKIAEKAKADVK